MRCLQLVVAWCRIRGRDPTDITPTDKLPACSATAMPPESHPVMRNLSAQQIHSSGYCNLGCPLLLQQRRQSRHPDRSANMPRADVGPTRARAARRERHEWTVTAHQTRKLTTDRHLTEIVRRLCFAPDRFYTAKTKSGRPTQAGRTSAVPPRAEVRALAPHVAKVPESGL
jgi:hypothetical protein